MNDTRSAAGVAFSGYPAKRLVDIVLASILIIATFVPGLLIALVIRLTSKGPVLYWSKRVGKRNKYFSMAKYRTMRTDTPVIATHLMDDPERYLTKVGRFLRRTSLDELPQLWNIIKGDMSLVGPRPALFNQDDLIVLRTESGVDSLLPGLTGWAQINGRDELPVLEKVRLDVEYLGRQSLMFDIKILFITVSRVIRRRGVSH